MPKNELTLRATLELDDKWASNFTRERVAGIPNGEVDL